MVSHKTMEAFWLDMHQKHHLPSLSGNGVNTIPALGIEDLLGPAQVILNIGVGLGCWEDYLAGLGKTVDCLDITPEAADAVKGVCRTFYTAPAALPVGEYDLITELLVAQHALDPVLEDHILHAVSALKPQGTYALQAPDFSSAPDGWDNSSLGCQMAGSVRRGVEVVSAMVARSRGRIVRVIGVDWYPQWNLAGYIYHIRRWDAPRP